MCALSIVMTNFTFLFLYISLSLYITSLMKSAKKTPLFDLTTKDKPITSYGVTARVNVIEGSVAFGFLQHFLPLYEYPLLSNLFTDQGYSSMDTGI